MSPLLKSRRLRTMNPLTSAALSDACAAQRSLGASDVAAGACALPGGGPADPSSFFGFNPVRSVEQGACRAAVTWRELPPVKAARLASYRYDSSPEYAAMLANATGSWLKTSLSRDGHARLRVLRRAGIVEVEYSSPSLIAANVPEAVFGQRVADPLPPFFASEVIVGQPEASVWDALLAPGVVEGDFLVELCILVLPDGWLRDCAAFLQASSDVAASYLTTLNRGDVSHSVANPAASELRRRADAERERLLSSGEQVQLFMTVRAFDERDLRAVGSVLLSGMAAVDGEGHLVPQRLGVGVDAVEDGVPLVKTHGALEPLVRVVPLAAAAVAAVPPTRAVQGLSVTSVDVRSDAHRAFASSGAPSEGDILLGGYEHGGRARLPVERFAKHVLVTGVPGTGKTTFVSGLARRLAARGVRVCVLEPAKIEYARLLDGLDPAFEVLGDDGLARPLRLNPLEADAGTKVALHVQDLSKCLISALGLDQNPLPLHLDQLLRRVYRENGIDLQKPQNGACPTMRELLAEVEPYVREQTFSGREVTANVLGALGLRARVLCDSPAFLARSGLSSADVVSRNHVIQLSDLGDEHGVLVGMLLLAKLVRFSRTLGTRELHTVVIVEEAHSLLQNAQGEFNVFSRLYEKALAELRSSGIGFVTVEQRPSLLPAGVLANSVTKVAFSSLHGDDREAIGKAMGLSDYQKRRLGGLGVGQAIVTTSGSQGADLVNIQRHDGGK